MPIDTAYIYVESIYRYMCMHILYIYIYIFICSQYMYVVFIYIYIYIYLLHMYMCIYMDERLSPQTLNLTDVEVGVRDGNTSAQGLGILFPTHPQAPGPLALKSETLTLNREP